MSISELEAYLTALRNDGDDLMSGHFDVLFDLIADWREMQRYIEVDSTYPPTAQRALKVLANLKCKEEP